MRECFFSVHIYGIRLNSSNFYPIKYKIYLSKRLNFRNFFIFGIELGQVRIVHRIYKYKVLEVNLRVVNMRSVESAQKNSGVAIENGHIAFYAISVYAWIGSM